MIHDWLHTQGLGEYAPVFAENEVDLAALPHLGKADLKEPGLPLGPRRPCGSRPHTSPEAPKNPLRGSVDGRGRHIMKTLALLTAAAALWAVSGGTAKATVFFDFFGSCGAAGPIGSGSWCEPGSGQTVSVAFGLDDATPTSAGTITSGVTSVSTSTWQGTTSHAFSDISITFSADDVISEVVIDAGSPSFFEFGTAQVGADGWGNHYPSSGEGRGTGEFVRRADGAVPVILAFNGLCDGMYSSGIFCVPGSSEPMSLELVLAAGTKTMPGSVTPQVIGYSWTSTTGGTVDRPLPGATFTFDAGGEVTSAVIGQGTLPFSGTGGPTEFEFGPGGLEALGAGEWCVNCGSSGEERGTGGFSTAAVVAVPEPGMLGLFGLGLVILATASRRRQR